jgi:hypothetical protein
VSNIQNSSRLNRHNAMYPEPKSSGFLQKLAKQRMPERNTDTAVIPGVFIPADEFTRPRKHSFEAVIKVSPTTSSAQQPCTTVSSSQGSIPRRLSTTIDTHRPAISNEQNTIRRRLSTTADTRRRTISNEEKSIPRRISTIADMRRHTIPNEEKSIPRRLPTTTAAAADTHRRTIPHEEKSIPRRISTAVDTRRHTISISNEEKSIPHRLSTTAETRRRTISNEEKSIPRRLSTENTHRLPTTESMRRLPTTESMHRLSATENTRRRAISNEQDTIPRRRIISNEQNNIPRRRTISNEKESRRHTLQNEQETRHSSTIKQEPLSYERHYYNNDKQRVLPHRFAYKLSHQIKEEAETPLSHAHRSFNANADQHNKTSRLVPKERLSTYDRHQDPPTRDRSYKQTTVTAEKRYPKPSMMPVPVTRYRKHSNSSMHSKYVSVPEDSDISFDTKDVRYDHVQVVPSHSSSGLSNSTESSSQSGDSYYDPPTSPHANKSMAQKRRSMPVIHAHFIADKSQKHERRRYSSYLEPTTTITTDKEEDDVTTSAKKVLALVRQRRSDRASIMS